MSHKKSDSSKDEKPWAQFKFCKLKCLLPECKECGWFHGPGNKEKDGKPISSIKIRNEDNLSIERRAINLGLRWNKRMVNV